MIRWRVERWRPGGVRPLEVWDLPFDGGLIYERLGAVAIERERAARRSEAEIDRRQHEAVEHLVQVMAPRDDVLVTGGIAARPGLATSLRNLARVRLAREPLFFAEAGAAAELRNRGFSSGLLVDLGQTSVKLAALGDPGSRVIVPRPLEELPRYFTERVPPPTRTAFEQAARLASLLSSAIAAELAPRSGLGPALVLGLPCELAADGTPGSCTYAGWAGDATFVPRMLARIDALLPASHDWQGREVLALVVNDAELAASSAALEGGVAHHRRTLVVSLGFGPGAAWLEPEVARGAAQP